MYLHRGKHATTTVLILIASWTIDTGLDFIKLVHGKTAIESYVISFIVAVVVFGILSEYVGSYTFNSTMPKIVAEFKRLNQRAIAEAKAGGRAVDYQPRRQDSQQRGNNQHHPTELHQREDLYAEH